MKRLFILLLFAFPCFAAHDFSGAYRHPNIPEAKEVMLGPPQTTNTFCAANLPCTASAAWTFAAGVPITGYVDLTGAGTSAVQTALNNLVDGQTLLIPCGTYTGPSLNHSNASIVSTCGPFMQDHSQTGGTSIQAKTVLTYSSAVTITSKVNLMLSNVSLDFADSGFGVTLSNDFGFNWSHVNLHECGNTSTPCLLITTNGTTSANNSADNHFDWLECKANTSTNQNAICIQLAGQGPVNGGSFATTNTFYNLGCFGFLRACIDSELNSDTNYFSNVRVANTIATPVANTAVIMLNNNTPASDQDADGGIYLGVNYTGPSWTMIRAGQSNGNVFSMSQGSGAGPSVSVAGGNPRFIFTTIGLPGVNQYQWVHGVIQASADATVGINGNAVNGDIVAARAAGGGVVFFGTGNSGVSFSSPAYTFFSATNTQADLKFRRPVPAGTNLTTGAFAFGGNWGTSPSFSSVVGTDAAFILNFSSGSGSPAANPTIQLTFTDGTWTNPPVCTVNRADGSSPTTAYWAPTVPGSATQLTLNFIGTPAASTSYAIVVQCSGKAN